MALSGSAFRSSRSTADLLTVASDRIVRAFNRSGATGALALDISKTLDMVWHAGFLHKLKVLWNFTSDIWPFFSLIDSFKCFWMGSLHKNILLILDFLKDSFLVLHFSYYLLMAFLMMLSVILLCIYADDSSLSMLMILLSTLSVIRHLDCSYN